MTSAFNKSFVFFQNLVIFQMMASITKFLDGLTLAVLAEEHTNPVEMFYCWKRFQELGARVWLIGTDRYDYIDEAQDAFRVEKLIQEVSRIYFDGLLIPGGLGPEKLRTHPQVLELVRDVHRRGKVIGAICHGQQVLISAGNLLKGRKAVAAWSMVDDLIQTGSIHTQDRAVRDGNIITSIFPFDLPIFSKLILETIAEIEKRTLPSDYGKILENKTFAILADQGTDTHQYHYLKYRLIEEGAAVLTIGRKSGKNVKLGSSRFPWAEMGIDVPIDRDLENLNPIKSDDFAFDRGYLPLTAHDLSGLILPGGIGTWLIRGHKGLHRLIQNMLEQNKLVASIERGAKILLSAGVAKGRRITCSPACKDDLIYGGASVEDAPISKDGSLITAMDTAAITRFVEEIVKHYRV